MFENLEATILFRKRKIKFKIPEDKLILALGLTIDTRPTNNNNYLEQISNQVYPGVWGTDIPDFIKIELQTRVGPVVRKQYPLRLENRKE